MATSVAAPVLAVGAATGAALTCVTQTTMIPAAASGAATRRMSVLRAMAPPRSQACRPSIEPRLEAPAPPPGRRQDALELGEVAESPLGQHGATRVQRDRVRAAG